MDINKLIINSQIPYAKKKTDINQIEVEFNPDEEHIGEHSVIFQYPESQDIMRRVIIDDSKIKLTLMIPNSNNYEWVKLKELKIEPNTNPNTEILSSFPQYLQEEITTVPNLKFHNEYAPDGPFDKNTIIYGDYRRIDEYREKGILLETLNRFTVFVTPETSENKTGYIKNVFGNARTNLRHQMKDIFGKSMFGEFKELYQFTSGDNIVIILKDDSLFWLSPFIRIESNGRKFTLMNSTLRNEQSSLYTKDITDIIDNELCYYGIFNEALFSDTDLTEKRVIIDRFNNYSGSDTYILQISPSLGCPLYVKNNECCVTIFTHDNDCLIAPFDPDGNKLTFTKSYDIIKDMSIDNYYRFKFLISIPDECNNIILKGINEYEYSSDGCLDSIQNDIYEYLSRNDLGYRVLTDDLKKRFYDGVINNLIDNISIYIKINLKRS